MPRLRRKRKERRSDFLKSLVRFLADPTRKFWMHTSQYIAIRCGEHEALLKDREAGSLQRAVLSPRTQISTERKPNGC
jgi:hypothetical protein